MMFFKRKYVIKFEMTIDEMNYLDDLIQKDLDVHQVNGSIIGYMNAIGFHNRFRNRLAKELTRK